MDKIKNDLAIISAHDAYDNGAVSCREWLALVTTYMLRLHNPNNANYNLDSVSDLLKCARKYVFGGDDLLEDVLKTYTFGEACRAVFTLWASRLDDETTLRFCNSVGNHLRLVESFDGGYLSFSNKLFDVYSAQNQVHGESISNYEWRRVDSIGVAQPEVPTDNVAGPSDPVFPSAAFDSVQSVPEVKDALGDASHDASPSTPASPQEHAEVTISYTPIPRRQVKNFTESEADLDLEAFWESLCTRSAFNYSQPYFWQMKITQSEYSELKEKLTACVNAHSEAEDLKLLRRHAWPIACYVAEYYKREYIGYCDNAANGNELQQLRLRNDYQEIVKATEIDKMYIYVSTERSHMWQDSLRMLGGLPIRYIASTNRFSNILSTLISIYQDSDSNDDDEQLQQFEERLNNLTNGISGVALSGSIKQHHSIYEYVRALLSDETPFADEDANEETFVAFKEILDEAKKQLRKKFQWQWTLYHDDTAIYPELKLVFSGKDPDEQYSHYISTERLSKWTRQNCEFPRFWLGVRFLSQDTVVKDIKQLAYFSFNGAHYVHWGGSKPIACELPAIGFDRAECYIIAEDKEYDILETFDYPGYAQVYQMDNPYLWGTARRDAFSSIVYDTDKWEPVQSDGEDPLLSWNGQTPSYVWTHIKNRELLLRHVESGEEVHFCSPFGLQFVPDRLKALLYTNGAEFAYLAKNEDEDKEEEEEKRMVPILFSNNFSVIVEDRGRDTTTLIRPDDRHLRVSFRPFGKRGGFMPFENFAAISQQLIDIKVEYKGRSVTDTVFYIYVDDPNRRKRWITRNVSDRVVNFNKAIKGVKKPSNDLLRPNNESLWDVSSLYEDCLFHAEHEHFTYPDDLDIKTYPSDVIPFLIKGGQGDVVVPVIRPRKTTRMYLDNRMIKEYDSGSISGIPFILRKHFRLRSFTNDGIEERRFDPKAWQEDGYWCLDIQGKYPKKTEIERSNDLFYFATDRIISREGQCLHLDLGAKTAEAALRAYEFYYWDYSEKPPMKLDAIYDISQKRLSISLPQMQSAYIVFQSLANAVEARHYCKPLYGSQPPRRETDQNEKIPPRNIYNRAFNIAKEHKIYFTLFEPFTQNAPFATDLWLAEIWLRHVEECGMKLTEASTEALYRLAEEMSYDWLFLPEAKWKTACNKVFGRDNPHGVDAMHMVKEFLKCNPYLDGTIQEREALSRFVDERETLIKNSNRIPQEIKLMTHTEKSYLFKKDSEDRKTKLKKFYSARSPISNLLARLQE